MSTRDATGIERPRTRDSPLRREHATRLRIAINAAPGVRFARARELVRTLYTPPTHSRLSRDDLQALAAWIASRPSKS